MWALIFLSIKSWSTHTPMHTWSFERDAIHFLSSNTSLSGLGRLFLITHKFQSICFIGCCWHIKRFLLNITKMFWKDTFTFLVAVIVPLMWANRFQNASKVNTGFSYPSQTDQVGMFQNRYSMKFPLYFIIWIEKSILKRLKCYIYFTHNKSYILSPVSDIEMKEHLDVIFVLYWC